MLSRNESLAPLPPPLRQSLAALIQAYDQGLGPVEREARARRATHAPMTDREIATFAEIHYPGDVRNFLDALGYQSFYRGDLRQALAVSAEGEPASGPDAGATAGPGHSDRRAALAATVLRLAVLALALAAGGLILYVGLPKIQAERASPGPVPAAAVEPPPPTRSAEEMLCRQAMQNDAAAWCESALTGARAQGPTAETSSGSCGDPLRANSDTVRVAVNGLLDDAASDTDVPAEARARCAAAAGRAVPR